MSILNLTQHVGTPEQDVLEPKDKGLIKKLLTFTGLPARETVLARAEILANVAADHKISCVMIGGAPFFMAPLERALQKKGITPVYAYSERVSMENPATGEKTSVFSHVGFVPAVRGES